jgi:hypothetical protein
MNKKAFILNIIIFLIDQTKTLATTYPFLLSEIWLPKHNKSFLLKHPFENHCGLLSTPINQFFSTPENLKLF